MEFPDYRDRERQQVEDREKAKQKRDQLKEDLSWVMTDQRGQRVIRQILSQCRLVETNFTGNSETFRLEGRREVALSLAQWMREADPNQTRKIIGDLFVGTND